MRDRKEIEQLIQNSKHFCMVPWVHLHVTALGNMSPCMSLLEGSEASGYGSLNEHSFQELWQGERIRKLRLRMLEDKPSFNCKKCYERDSIGYWSQRRDSNEKYGKYLDWVETTDENGYAHDAKPVHWDVRFSNLCNLKCRMCSYSASSAWYEDAINLGQIDPEQETSKVRGVENTEPFLQELEEYIPYVDKLHFAGGEPLLLNENAYILERLRHHKKFDTEIKYNTNLTNLSHRSKNIVEQWRYFENIQLNVSIDGVGERCEYVRKNLNWDKFLKNIEIVKMEKNVDLIINITVSIFNIMKLVEIHKYMYENNYINLDKICINLLHYPEFYSAKLLPSEMKKQVTEEILNHLSWLRQQAPYNDINQDYDPESLDQWESVIAYMNSEDWTHLIPRFFENTAKLDELRNENLLDVFPELRVLNEHQNKGMGALK
ncbi:twitch domain-containing radical SAM protein [Paenibacillus polysaccharolyticus]|uniref:twitch domain-containing radical SAM protein n=1 Tax=Paenibacillus polysaccharolyticus TaxID=582692 RepID=UPI0020404A1A|nr:twitch domain-containing radical SAM protein [Paenibacillus polysaccharolyticus]MCM3135794.1 twitch domain-containing radical SAM protein [Paenibacillus polysaccharolyticus]